MFLLTREFGVLMFEMPLVSSGDFLPAFFSFNLGIEFGQLAVIGMACAAVALWRKRDCYREAIARPASAVIAASSIYFAFERSI